MKSHESIRRLVRAALFCALVCVSTIAVQIPIPATSGYVHPGDALCLLAAFLLPMGDAIIAAGVGSFLADALTGYFLYAPATLVIKGGIALIAYLIFRIFRDKGIKEIWIGSLLGGIAGEAWMVAGYLAYETVLYGFYPALSSVLWNTLQGVFGVFVAVILCRALQGKLNRK